MRQFSLVFFFSEHAAVQLGSLLGPRSLEQLPHFGSPTVVSGLFSKKLCRPELGLRSAPKPRPNARTRLDATAVASERLPVGCGGSLA